MNPVKLFGCFDLEFGHKEWKLILNCFPYLLTNEKAIKAMTTICCFINHDTSLVKTAFINTNIRTLTVFKTVVLPFVNLKTISVVAVGDKDNHIYII